MTEPPAENPPSPSDSDQESGGDPTRRFEGRSLGPYRIARRIGQGSMGIVYEAEHEHLGQRVALKVLHAGPGTSPTVIQRFLREAQAVARLSHDHIVPIYAVGESGETHFYAMQFLEGASLDRHLAKDGPSTPENAARITATAARALHYAHELGIIHRDVKPANIVQQPDGKIVITDFGLARSERAASLTDSGAMVGTPLYMSPEQVHARRDNVDRRTDVYSLGATMYELATGRPPFQGETTQEVLQKILDEEPVPPRLVVRNLPPELEAITLKCLEKSPRHRYATGLELAQDLERFLEGEPILARRTGTFARLTRRMRKHRTISLLSATIVLVSVALVVVSFSLASRSQDATVTQLLSEARAEFQGQTYLGAERAYRQAVELAPNHSEALLGHARSLLAFGSLWQQQVEQDAQSVEAESWAAEFGTPQAVFDQGVERVEQVLAQDTEQPLAFLCRGGLFFQLALCLLTTTDEEPPAAAQELFEKSVRDIDWADQLSNSREEPEYWEAQAEVAQVRYDYVTRFPLAPPLADRLMQRSLDNETKAIDLLRRRIEIGRRPRRAPVALASVRPARADPALLVRTVRTVPVRRRRRAESCAAVSRCLRERRQAGPATVDPQRARQDHTGLGGSPLGSGANSGWIPGTQRGRRRGPAAHSRPDLQCDFDARHPTERRHPGVLPIARRRSGDGRRSSQLDAVEHAGRVPRHTSR